MIKSDEHFALNYLAENMVEGSFWAVCPVEDYEYYSKLGLDNKKYTYTPLKSNSGILIRTDIDSGIQSLEELLNEKIAQEELENIQTNLFEGTLKFRYFIENNKGYKGFIGICETTSTDITTVAQKEYPSFRVGIEEVLHQFRLNRVSYWNKDNQWVVADDSTSVQDIVMGCTVSPTRNCIVIPIKIKG